MPIRVACPNCSAVLNAPDAAGGKTVKCPKCQAPMLLPAAPPPAVRAAAVAPAKPPAPRRDDEDDDDLPQRRRDRDEDEARPRRKSKAGRKRKKKVPPVLLMASGVAALVIVAVGGYFAVSALTGGQRNAPGAKGGSAGGSPSNTSGEGATNPLRAPPKYYPLKETSAKLEELIYREGITDKEIFAIVGEPTERTEPETITNINGVKATFYAARWKADASGSGSEVRFADGRPSGCTLGLSISPLLGGRR